MTAMVTGITALLKPGFRTSRPSTALNTEIAGVISASQKKNAVPASASPTATFAQVLPVISRRCASANSARIPPSPSLSARMMTVRYFRVTEMARLQKISDSTPSTASVLKVPAAASDCCIAYSGLVPMSPYTMPVAPITADTLTRRGLFRWIACRGPAPRRRPQHGAAAALEAAAAREDGVDVRRVVRFALDLVIVAELLARFDGADRVGVHALVLDQRFAVRLAGVIHEARLVAIDAGVDHGVRVDDEQEGVVVARILAVVTTIRFRMRDALAPVLDDACAARDAPRGKHTQAVQARIAHLDQRRQPAGVCRVH